MCFVSAKSAGKTPIVKTVRYVKTTAVRWFASRITNAVTV